MTPNIDKIIEHYNHAREKHPYFCDELQPNDPMTRVVIKARLLVIRNNIRHSITDGNLEFDELLNCELWEVQEAIANGNKAHAVEELYDCIAVCLRTIDVLEGRQKLGKPEEVKQ